MRSSRVSVRDRVWMTTPVIRVAGPLEGCGPDRLRAALRVAYLTDPTCRVASRLDPDHPRWEPLTGADIEASLPDRVRDLGPAVPSRNGTAPVAASPEAVTDYLRDSPLDDRPLILAVQGPYVGIKASHGLGDGRIIDGLLAALLAAAAEPGTGVDARATAPRRGWRLPLLTAAGRQFAQHPSALVPALRVDRPPTPSTPEPGPGAETTAYVTASSEPGVVDRLRAYRDARVPGVSVVALLSAAVYRAFATSALSRPDPGVVMLIDARRYLPPDAVVPGNFSWGQYVRPDDPGDPRAYDRVLRSELASGRALAMMALRDLHTILRPVREPTPPGLPEAPTPVLTLSHLGRLTAFDSLPWKPGAPRFVSLVPSAGPGSISLTLAEMRGAVHVSATFLDGGFDRADVADAVRRIADDPVALLAASAADARPDSPSWPQAA